MLDLQGLQTEGRNPETMELDKMSALELVQAMNREDKRAVQSVGQELSKVAELVDWAGETLKKGGRILYLGAGTSGRLGLLDAAECPPTFGVSPDTVVGLIAGGEMAFVRAVEGAEDDMELSKTELKKAGLRENDLVIGLAASGRTPYVIGGLRFARRLGCKTAAISCTAGAEMSAEADLAIEVQTGPEVLTGSTRLKAGTAQKLILNMISTGAMVQAGKVYENLMVDMCPTNEKLKARAIRMVDMAAGCGEERARQALLKAGGDIKTAIVMVLAAVDCREAKERLRKSEGNVRKAVEA